MQNICLVHHSLYSTRLLLLNWPKSCQVVRNQTSIKVFPLQWTRFYHVVSIPTKLNFLFSQCFQTILATLCKANQGAAPRVKLASFHLTTINNKVKLGCYMISMLPKCSWCLKSSWCLLQASIYGHHI